jgi:hypothetical protein
MSIFIISTVADGADVGVGVARNVRVDQPDHNLTVDQ